ncbi:MAG: hypothetical protein IKR32_05930 [Bacteroidales bacterium]|nr:hypothetical protein [Bacteroidales bacterium]
MPGIGGIRAVYLATFGSAWPNATADFSEEIVIDDGRYVTHINFMRPDREGYWSIACGDLQDEVTGAQIYAAIMDVVPFTHPRFYRIDIARQGAEITSTMQDGEDNNASYFENVLTIPIRAISPEAVEVISRLSGASCLAVVETNAGNLIPLGLSGAKLSAASLTSGAQPGDRAGEEFQIREFSPWILPAKLIISANNYGYEYADAMDVTPAIFRDIFVID